MMYANLPAGRYVQRKIEESGIKKVEVIRLCGWKNINKGLRRLDALIRDSVRDFELLKKLVAVLKLDKKELNQQIMLTNTIREMEDAKREKERRANWRPFLYALTEREMPTSIAMSSICGGEREKYAKVPEEVTSMPFETHISEAGKLIKDHYARKSGKTYFFSAIVGYLYQYTCDYAIEFSIEGEVVGGKSGVFNPPRSELRIGNKSLVGGLLPFFGHGLEYRKQRGCK